MAAVTTTQPEGAKADVKCEGEGSSPGSSETATQPRLEGSNPPAPSDSAMERYCPSGKDFNRFDPWLNDQPAPFDPDAL